jgi:hypothetical protein
MKIGFIGLGNMGAPMAANLIKAGHEVTGFDVAGVTVEGAANAASAAEAASGQDAVITMLPNGEILRSVYAEIVPAGTKGSLFIDCSTVDVDSARAAHEMAAANGLLSVDAPVSGGVGGAAAGTLTFMVWRQRRSVLEKRREPVFEIMGQESGSLRRGRRWSVRQDLQQHAARHLHDRRLRSLLARRESSACPQQGAVRCRFDLVRLLLVGQHLLPGSGHRTAEPGRQRLQAGLCGRT